MKKLECDLCGGGITIVSTDGFGQCDFCSAKFSPDVMKHQIEIIKGTVSIEGSVSVAGIQTLEKLASNAQKFLDLGRMSAAEAVYDQITTNYPEDYRGWWGLLKYSTEKFTRLDIEDYQMGYWNSVVAVATEEQVIPLEETFSNYLSTVIDTHEEEANDVIAISKKEVATYSKHLKYITYSTLIRYAVKAIILIRLLLVLFSGWPMFADSNKILNVIVSVGLLYITRPNLTVAAFTLNPKYGGLSLPDTRSKIKGSLSSTIALISASNQRLSSLRENRGFLESGKLLKVSPINRNE